MKTHTTGFKNAVKELGRQLRAVITYGNVTLEEEIYSITPHYNADLLKSVMKQLDLELSVDIPLETVLNCRIGILVNGSYEMLNYGNYVVYKSEKQEDTNTYKLTCYDKMLYSMKQNEDLGIPYPISIKNYLIAICNKLGLTLKTTTFQNESRMIQNELYLGLDYTYRDILDEIAQATGSIICLNENDEVLVKYPTQTNDTIDEEFLKDVNVDFGQMYGAINTIVLSRSGESDNIYYPETLPENPIEIKIKDNQIMNWNDRSDYLPGIYNALNGLYYYINDFSSTGILYYEVGDLYNVRIGENTYQCLMLNDEINVTTGIEEIIHTDMPEKSETDYSKADKTDMRINKTYLIVDKQNQKIDSVVKSVTKQNDKISKMTQTVDELNSKISDIADITTSLESNSARLEFESINHSEPIRVVIHPVGANISKLYPNTSLKPSTNLTIKTRILRFTNTTTQEVWNYEIPDDLLYYDSENYDEFILDYDGLSCVINKKCKWNNDGTVGLLPSERTNEYEFPHIELTDGDYTVELIQYSNGYIFARLMAQNRYTTQFATKAELNSEISQTTKGINLSVDKKLSNYSTTSQMNSAIDLKASQITQTVSETYVTNQSLKDNYSTTEQTATMISTTVSQTTKNNLKDVTVEYALGTSTTTAPTSGWSTTAPTWQQGKYMWQRTKTKTADGTESISNPTCIAGATGQTGATGKGVKAAVAQYYLSSSKTSQTGGSWAETQPAYKKDYYYWTRTKITWTDNTTTYTTPILVEEINSLNESVASLNIRAGDIESTVRKKVGNDEIISKINQSAEAVQINANKIDIDGKAVHFKTNISVKIGPFTNQDRTKLYNYFSGTGTLTAEEKQRYDITGDGTLNILDAMFIQKAINNGGYYTFSGYYEIDPYSYNKSIRIYDNNSNKFKTILSLIYNYINYLYTEGINVNGQLVVKNEYGQMFTQSNNDDTRFELYIDGDIRAEHQITCENLIQTSKEENKKNFEKFQNALEIIKSIDIYKYNMKSQEDKEKKHIGFVIGDNYNYSKEVTSIDNEGVDNYSFTSLCCKAIQEQQEEIEELKKEIEKLKGGK